MGRLVGRRVSPCLTIDRKYEKATTNGATAIESRVARIKARVAELTGGIDGQNGATARR